MRIKGGAHHHAWSQKPQRGWWSFRRILPIRRRVGPNLNLDLHPEGEAGDADATQDGLVIWHILPHVVNEVPYAVFGDVGRMVQLYGVDVLPAHAGQRERVLDVVEGAVDLLDETRLDLAGLTVPAA